MLGLGLVGFAVALTGGRVVGGLDLGWILVVAPVAGVVFCVITIISSARQSPQSRRWLFSWVGVFAVSTASGWIVQALGRGSWTAAFLMSYAVGCFAVAGCLTLRRRQART